MINFQFSKRTLRRCSGQAMTVAVLFMSGLILTGTTVAGLLLTYQIRQGFDAAFSTQAIYAADGGIEEALYCYFFHGAEEDRAVVARDCTREADRQECFSPSGACYTTTLAFPPGSNDRFTVRSVGTSQRTERILFTEVVTR